MQFQMRPVDGRPPRSPASLEGLRHGNPPDTHLPDFSAVEVELADCIIRIVDAAAGYNWRVAEALVAKLAYNRHRAFKHGKGF